MPTNPSISIACFRGLVAESNRCNRVISVSCWLHGHQRMSAPSSGLGKSFAKGCAATHVRAISRSLIESRSRPPEYRPPPSMLPGGLGDLIPSSRDSSRFLPACRSRRRSATRPPVARQNETHTGHRADHPSYPLLKLTCKSLDDSTTRCHSASIDRCCIGAGAFPGIETSYRSFISDQCVTKSIAKKIQCEQGQRRRAPGNTTTHQKQFRQTEQRLDPTFEHTTRANTSWRRHTETRERQENAFE